MRAFICFLGVVLALPVPAVRGQELSEQQALLRLSAESAQARALQLGVELARANARAEGLPPNGSAAFSREAAGGVPETYLLYHQPLSITGRRQFLRRAAEAAADSEEMHVRSQLHELRVDLRIAFLDLLLAQEEFRVIRSERGRLEEVVDVLRKRERLGESSGYDRLRAERDLSLLLAEQGGLEARLETARAALASFFSPAQAGDSLIAVGALTLPALPDRDSLMARSLKRGDIQAEQYSAESSILAGEAARRKLYPEPILSGGLKSPVVDGRRDSGYVLSVTVPLPLFDRGQAEMARAEAARRAAVARAEAIRAEVSRQVRGVWEATQAMIRTAAAYQQRVLSQTEDLVKIARAAYEGGEVGILELLDAYRNQREVRLRALDLTAAARRSALGLERLVGEEVIP